MCVHVLCLPPQCFALFDSNNLFYLLFLLLIYIYFLYCKKIIKLLFNNNTHIILIRYVLRMNFVLLLFLVFLVFNCKPSMLYCSKCLAICSLKFLLSLIVLMCMKKKNKRLHA